MAQINSINWESAPEDFLNPNQTNELAQAISNGELITNLDEVMSDLTKEMDKGLSAAAFNINGRAPLYELSLELMSRLKKTVDDLTSLGQATITAGNKHTVEEVNTYYDEVMKEYNRRKELLRIAVDNYNDNRIIQINTNKKDENGNDIFENVTLSKIKLINGEDNNFQRVIISGKKDERSQYYEEVQATLKDVEAIYPKPENANRYKAMWGNLPGGEGVKSKSSSEEKSHGKWTSYDDAFMDGYNNILTRKQFEANKPNGYETYQDYLDAMYEEYLRRNKNIKYKPHRKEGKLDTELSNNGVIIYFNTIEYEGEYIEFDNEDGILVRAPLAIATYQNGKIVYVPMTEEQKEAYINKVTFYYNDIMDIKNNLYSDKFKQEIRERVETNTIIYVDPKSRQYIDDAKNKAAFTQPIGFNHSDIVIYSDQFIDFDENNIYYNTKEEYNYMLEAYTHENGHAYANNRFIDIFDRDEIVVWENIYDQVKSDPANVKILRDYSLSTKKELFADSTAYYFHDPDRLNNVEIDITVHNKKFDNLYDYMDYILN